MSSLKILISGGGTGGHIFPAIAIADEFKKRHPGCDVLFVGAKGKMEMDKVPKAGYKIVGLPIVGLRRGFYFSNFLLPFKLLGSMFRARQILINFKPDIVIGVGGYASGPTLKSAQLMKIPTIIQEQNSFAGKTNKLLAQKALRICVAYDNMEVFFPKNKIVITGNPVRSNLQKDLIPSKKSFDDWGLNPSKKTILIIGGSLGAKTLNDSVLSELEFINNREDIQLIWQSGKRYLEEIKQKLKNNKPNNLILKEFIFDMNKAYSMADLVISRSGALSISELCLLGKPSILVPSPNVAEDHQTTNALALVKNDAAILIKDKDAKRTLIRKAAEIVCDNTLLKDLSSNSLKLAKPNATCEIVDECESLLKETK
jgi:UDP-N-acetylglucosamine--N-acetylmuramyl-(pentapeptide) pyrophosphoryl-undecaprenol N-acetylglucosamine transferase